MKKLFAFTILITLSMSAGFSQLLYDTLALPNHIVGRSMNEEGEITKEYPADFTYYSNNDLFSFVFPEYELTSQFFYEQRLLNFNVTTYSLLEYDEHYYITHEYEYENGLLQREQNIEREYTYQNTHYQFIDYYYDEEERLLKKEDSVAIGQRNRWLYDYQNNGKTLIVTHYSKYNGYYHLRRVSTYQYDDDNLLRDVLIENHDINNEIEVTKQTYTYTERKKPASEIKQTLVDNEWVNTTIHNYIYGNNGRIAEQQDGVWSEELNDWDIINKVMHEYSNSNTTYTVSFYKKSGDDWVWDEFRGQKLFFEPELKWQQDQLELFFFGDFYHRINQIEFSMTNTITFSIPEGSEWYYEILNDDGTITYQHLEYAADTTIGTERPKIIVRTNTIYDRDAITTEVTHEYVFERDGKVYWWNKDLEEFTVLYDLTAEAGDEWEIKVGTESILVHVDSVGMFEYEGNTRKMLHISDAEDLFSGDIVVGYGHLTSFFPERLMNRGKGYRVEGLRCYWVGDALLYHNGDQDCDAIYAELHNGINEDGPSTGSGTFTVYPNPTDGVLTVSVRLPQCDSPTTGQTAYRITNQMGQTLLTGNISAETQQIDITNLPAGMYFISVGGQTVKFVVR